MSPEEQEKIDRLLAEVKETAARLEAYASPPPVYSRKLIERYRAQNFRREITERVLATLDYDRITLSCGHTLLLSAKLLDAAPSGMHRCGSCANDWVAKAVEEERNGS